MPQASVLGGLLEGLEFVVRFVLSIWFLATYYICAVIVSGTSKQKEHYVKIFTIMVAIIVFHSNYEIVCAEKLQNMDRADGAARSNRGAGADEKVGVSQASCFSKRPSIQNSNLYFCLFQLL